MRITTKGRYGLRIMLELAVRYGGGPVTMSDIELSQGISRKYMHALLSRLKAAGLVNAVRGSGGGYLLAVPPSRIRLSDVVEALEGPFSVVGCVEDNALCERTEYCATREVWRDVSEAVRDVLSEITLEQLAARQNAKRDRSVMYHI
jgi:Rrf2 family protein